MLVVALMAASSFGVYRTVFDGRFRGTRSVRAADPYESTAGKQGLSVLEGSGFAQELGERATLLQFSSAFCAPCRATRRILGDVAQVVPGVVHLEVDAEQHLELVRRLGILRTPTTVILDRNGAEVSRASGAPRKEQVLATLAEALG